MKTSKHRKTSTASSTRDSCLVDDASSDESSDVDCWSWVVLAGAFIVQLTVPSVLSAFGVLVALIVEYNGVSLFTVIWIPVLYVSIWSFSEPVCRMAVDVESGCGKYIAIMGVIISAGGVSASSFVHIPYLRIISFSIVGGLGASLMSAQMNAVLYSHFPEKSGLVQVVLSAGSGLGQLVMPIAMYGLLMAYGTNGAPLMLAGIVLQGVLGASLFVPPIRRLRSEAPSPNCIKNNAAPESVIVEMDDPLDRNSSNSPLLSTAGRSWKNPAKDNPDFENLIKIEQELFNPSYSPTSLYRRKNVFGVDILPEIPEECEDVDEIDSSIKKRDSKRRSFVAGDSSNSASYTQQRKKGRIRKMFERKKYKVPKDTRELVNEFYNFKVVAVNGDVAFTDVELDDQNEKYSLNVFDDAECCKVNEPTSQKENDFSSPCESVTCSINNISSDSENTTSSTAKLLPPTEASKNLTNATNGQIPKTKRPSESRDPCCICRLYPDPCQCARRLSRVCVSCTESVSQSLRQTLRTPHLFSSLLLRFATRLCPMIFVTLAPTAIRTYISDSSFEEAVFDMSVFGFSWLCFLVTSPWFVNMSSHRKKFLYSTGCVISSTGFYLFGESDSHDQIILNCVIIGIGQGAALSTATTVVQDALGPWDFKKYNTLLDILSGIMVILASTFIGLILGNDDDTQSCFSFLAVVQIISAVSWLVRPILARFKDHRNNVASDWSTGEFIASG